MEGDEMTLSDDALKLSSDLVRNHGVKAPGEAIERAKLDAHSAIAVAIQRQTDWTEELARQTEKQNDLLESIEYRLDDIADNL